MFVVTGKVNLLRLTHTVRGLWSGRGTVCHANPSQSNHSSTNGPDLRKQHCFLERSLVSTWNINTTHILTYGPYRAVNTPHLGYKNQSVNAVQ
jgi:hypothetical protein